MSKIEQLEAQLELLRAEEAFREKKKSGEVTEGDKLELRALRQEYREKYRQPTKEGAAPDAIKNKAKANN